VGACGHLNQAELRPVGGLSNKFSIDRKKGQLSRKTCDKPIEALGSGKKVHRIEKNS
jgi:hypothetical protein